MRDKQVLYQSRVFHINSALVDELNVQKLIPNLHHQTAEETQRKNIHQIIRRKCLEFLPVSTINLDISTMVT